jgi:hypothetical protein
MYAKPEQAGRYSSYVELLQGKSNECSAGFVEGHISRMNGASSWVLPEEPHRRSDQKTHHARANVNFITP